MGSGITRCTPPVERRSDDAGCGDHGTVTGQRFWRARRPIYCSAVQGGTPHATRPKRTDLIPRDALQLNAVGLANKDSLFGTPDSIVGQQVLAQHFPAGAGEPVAASPRPITPARYEQRWLASGVSARLPHHWSRETLRT